MDILTTGVDWMNKTAKWPLALSLIAACVFVFFLVRTSANEITRQEAKTIALDHLGVGVVNEVTQVTENGRTLYEVEVLDEETQVRFLVYVYLETGEVARMERFEPGYHGITTLPEVLSPEEQEAFSADEDAP